MKTEGYSIWLSSDNDTNARFASIINELGNKIGTPVFPPHITLLSGMRYPVQNMTKKVQTLASEVNNFPIEGKRIESGDHYFQSLYIKMKTNVQLLKLRSRAEELLEANRPSPFYPHLSLLYGEINQSEKDRLIQKLEDDLADFTFFVQKLLLMDTDGSPENWSEIEKFYLMEAE